MHVSPLHSLPLGSCKKPVFRTDSLYLPPFPPHNHESLQLGTVLSSQVVSSGSFIGSFNDNTRHANVAPGADSEPMESAELISGEVQTCRAHTSAEAAMCG